MPKMTLLITVEKDGSSKINLTSDKDLPAAIAVGLMDDLKDKITHSIAKYTADHFGQSPRSVNERTMKKFVDKIVMGDFLQAIDIHNPKPNS